MVVRSSIEEVVSLRSLYLLSVMEDSYSYCGVETKTKTYINLKRLV